MLHAGQQLPRFEVTTLGGGRVEYSTLWQRKNVVLIMLGEERSPGVETYLTAIHDHMSELTAYDTVCLITRDAVPDVAPPAVVIADRWGEIYFAGGADAAETRLPPDEIVAWLRAFQMKC